MLPLSLNKDLMSKNLSGGTISFKDYCRKKLYKENDRSFTTKSLNRNFEFDFPSSPD